MSKLKDTYWIPTLHLNVVRVLSATISLTLLFILGRLTGILSGPTLANASILGVLIIPAALLTTGLAMILFCKVAGSMGLPMTGLVASVMSLAMVVFIAVGDPLIWIVRRYYPAIVPAQRFHIINPRAVILVQRDGQNKE
jgi:hypothetical protein